MVWAPIDLASRKHDYEIVVYWGIRVWVINVLQFSRALSELDPVDLT